MKSTGIVRKIDELGRIVLPKELRMTLDIKEKDPLKIFVDEDGRIVLGKYEPACIFCDSMNEVATFKGHSICHECMKKVASRLEE
jgi:AbrB family transcriptional regulator, transcriptional pleiotropic regulator of transition state genes